MSTDSPGSVDGLRAVWAAVDAYVCDHFAKQDAALEAALEQSAAAGLPAHQVSANEGKLLTLLAQLRGAERILEIGTLGGYSTIWLARGLAAGGMLVTLEANAKHAEVARTNIAAAGLADRVDVRVGPALETLPGLRQLAPFDMIFIDADKANNADYFDCALQLSRRGTLIVADNVIRNGTVIDATSSDPSVRGIRRFNERVAADPRVSATAIQTVGSKGYDGFALALVVREL